MDTTIPEEVIENIRRENDIVDVVEEYVQLKKQGRNYFGLCPFHDEKSPSFSVTKDKQIFHCFGCRKGGNVITFLMEMESFTFIEAIQFLAKRSGIQLPEMKTSGPVLSNEANTILSVYDWLTKYYHHLLKYTDEGKVGLDYLLDRGMAEKGIDDFQLGYAPSNSEFTIDFLKKKGFHTQLLVKAGVLSTKDNQHFVDVFRGRVIYPIKNHLGRTVAFSGRAVHQEQPKYLNSAEHELFQKGNLLFNFHLAKGNMRKLNEVILFEGNMDVIQAYSAGIKHCVATLGTSLNIHQAKLLHRYVESVVICFDADDAGIKASFDAANIFKQIGCEVKVALLEENMDPDEYIKTYGANAFKEALDHSDTYFSFYMRYQKRHYNLQTDSERIAYIEDITKELAKITSTIEKEYYVKEIADEFNLSTDIIYYDMEQHEKRNNVKFKDKYRGNSNTSTDAPSIRRQSKINPAFQNAERYLLSYMLKHPYIVDKVQNKLGINFNMEEHKIILTHLYALYEESNDMNVSKLIDKLTEPYLREMVTELTMLPTNDNISDQEINDYMNLIQRERNDISYLRILKQKQKQEQNPFLAAKIGLEIIELEKQLKQS